MRRGLSELDSGAPLDPVGCAVRAGAASGSRWPTRRWSRIWSSWSRRASRWSRTAVTVELEERREAGRRGCVSRPPVADTTVLKMLKDWAMASRRTARRRRAPRIPIVTPSSAASTSPAEASSPRGEPVISVDTKKKELSVTTPARGGPRANPSWSAATTSRNRSLEGDPLRDLRPRRRHRLGQRRHRQRHRPFRGRVHSLLVAAPRVRRYPTPPRSRSPPTAAAATATAAVSGSPNCNVRRRHRPRDPGPPLPRPAPANGTRSSTACSASSPDWRGEPLAGLRTRRRPHRRHRRRLARRLRLPRPNAYPGRQVTDKQLAAVNLTGAATTPTGTTTSTRHL